MDRMQRHQRLHLSRLAHLRQALLNDNLRLLSVDKLHLWHSGQLVAYTLLFNLTKRTYR